MKSLRKLTVILFALLGVVASAFITQSVLERYKAKPAPVLNGQIANIGSPLPHASMIDLQTNHDDSGMVMHARVLLVFLTTDCDACRKEIPNISQANRNLDSKVSIYGVCIEDREHVRQFVEENHVDFPILLDQGGRIISRLGFKFMPTKVLLENGIIKKIWYGSSPSAAALIQNIEEVQTQ
jgi:peroxiredoxin